MEYEILETRDYRGTLGLKFKGEIVEIENSGLADQFIKQGLIQIKAETSSRIEKEVVSKEVKVEEKIFSSSKITDKKEGKKDE